MNLKLTPAQQLILNGVLSLVGSAVIGAISAAYQYYDQNGQVSVALLLNFMLLTFLTLFGKSLYDYVPGHAQQLIQALEDSVEQARAAQQQLFDHMAHLQANTQPLPVAPPDSDSGDGHHQVL